jgi:hypothetical protein
MYFVAFTWFITVFTTARKLFLSWTKLPRVHVPLSHFFKIHFNIALPSMPMSFLQSISLKVIPPNHLVFSASHTSLVLAPSINFLLFNPRKLFVVTRVMKIVIFGISLSLPSSLAQVSSVAQHFWTFPTYLIPLLLDVTFHNHVNKRKTIRLLISIFIFLDSKREKRITRPNCSGHLVKLNCLWIFHTYTLGFYTNSRNNNNNNNRRAAKLYTI